MLHASELTRRWRSDRIVGVSAHPGIVATSLGQIRTRGTSPTWSEYLHNAGVRIWWQLIAYPVAEPVSHGAASVVYAALSPQIDGGEYVRHCQVAEPSRAAQNTSAAAFLWRESARLLATRV